jgi:phage FluMu protein Com
MSFEFKCPTCGNKDVSSFRLSYTDDDTEIHVLSGIEHVCQNHNCRRSWSENFPEAIELYEKIINQKQTEREIKHKAQWKLMFETPEEEYVAKECPHCYKILPNPDGEPDPYLGWFYCKRLGNYVRDINECRIRTAFRYEDKYLTGDRPD